MTNRELAELLRSNPDIQLVTDGSYTTVEPAAKPLAGKMSEHDLQAAVIAECDLRANQDPRWRLLFAIPNGGQRSKATAGKLKAEGVKAGVPDLCLAVPRAETRAHPAYHGLFLELKVEGRKPTGNQEMWLRSLREHGYYACWVDNAFDAMHILEWFLNGDV